MRRWLTNEPRNVDTERRIIKLEKEKKDKRSLVVPRQGIVHLPKILTDPSLEREYGIITPGHFAISTHVL